MFHGNITDLICCRSKCKSGGIARFGVMEEELVEGGRFSNKISKDKNKKQKNIPLGFVDFDDKSSKGEERRLCFFKVG